MLTQISPFTASGGQQTDHTGDAGAPDRRLSRYLYVTGYLDAVTGRPNRQRLMRKPELNADILPHQQQRLLILRRILLIYASVL
ncbi:hypothetical protein [Mixta intestinalis]|uniref:Uncharacterized protein n=1 Tax=Mixta intestinalis TaxID=1615494 RepID=A0A6P1PY88_9GAMM|nr:hypothetical protein [Mixta intestinalis]QHM70768.1 hypothetical protein C7M51_01047 [Mixta intestinalis]